MATSGRWLNYLLVGLHCLSSLAFAQFPPRITNDTVITLPSPINPNITIAYKSVPVGTCTTVFRTQKQYSGYITLPPDVLDPSQGNYTINTFFWFIEARQLPESAPLTIFINGGPGSSSMVGLFQEVGPCQVVEISNGLLGTVARDWGWDRRSNIIFIDQPVQVGFSYDTATNASLNLLDESILIPPGPRPLTQPEFTFLNGTFGSGNPSFTANTSQIAAQSIWHFLQTFLTSFPEYNTAMRVQAKEPVAEVHLFTESYGGKYGPAVGSFFKSQNDRRQNDIDFANQTIEVDLSSLGIINGWIDLLTQAPFHPRFAYENTYGIEAISQLQQLNALSAFRGDNGCQQLTLNCRALATTLDPLGDGGVEQVNAACSEAQYLCQTRIVGPYTISNRSIYDISQGMLDSFPRSLYLEYLNQASVQNAIGVPVNYTQDSMAVFTAFNATGDYARSGIVADLVDLLVSGVKVALIYGDRDYICNWLGGEEVSFAIAGAAGPSYLPWYSSGYAPIVANASYVGGVVRQFGNLSFSRIYDAGHLVPAYQPETMFTVFARIIAGTDIGTGNLVDLATFASSGDLNSTHLNSAPAMAAPTCYLRAMNSTCQTDQKNVVANNAGVIINGVLYDHPTDWHPPGADATTMAGVPGTAPPSMFTSAPPFPMPSDNSSNTLSTRSSQTMSSSAPLTATVTTSTPSLPTGVYTATGVPPTSSNPSPSSAASARHGPSRFMLHLDSPAAVKLRKLYLQGVAHVLGVFYAGLLF
ncbi:uncharacterized protein A1O9_12265 [Exophiala aquamarina CBS 119918]|uniref:Carboxypeptidase n=1 Tax=Exophiala aquamarina CBS 119918 TaxID=1182545 RepID=A0A072P7N8_9EURO|nr:uncharacterized protein A1O9_12265 [Exophiala aquamarina CBS 119918]KEF51630.1 hypothetical protein A1O9_12265 [Exophiala aquamarina CBS 119918]